MDLSLETIGTILKYYSYLSWGKLKVEEVALSSVIQSNDIITLMNHNLRPNLFHYWFNDLLTINFSKVLRFFYA